MTIQQEIFNLRKQIKKLQAELQVLENCIEEQEATE